MFHSLILAAVLLAGTAPPSHAPAKSTLTIANWTIEADVVDYNTKSGDFSTPGKVKLTRPSGTGTADTARGNYKKQIAVLSGNVQVTDERGFSGLVSGVQTSAEPATITTDELTLDGKHKSYKAHGNVHYVQGQRTADSTDAELDEPQHRLTMDTDVRIVDGGRRVNAEHIEYDTQTKHFDARGDVMVIFPEGGQ